MTLFVHTGGDHGESPAVIFLHGAGADHSVWRFQTRWLANRGWRVLAPDLAGHGASDGPVPTSIEKWAEWLEEFLLDRDAIGTVVGHSMGALMALEAAGREPGLIPRLVLVGAGVRMPVHPVLMAAAREDLPRAARFIAGWSMPPAHGGGHLESGTWQTGAIARLVERSRPGVLAMDLAVSAGYDAADRLAGVRAETLVVRGDADRMVAQHATRALFDGIGGARLVVLPGAGHEPMVQEPRLFNRLLADFLVGDGKGSSR